MSEQRDVTARGLLYESHEKAEEAIHVFIAVMPTLIVEIAKDIHQRWLDGQQQESEQEVIARVERIVREKFSG